MEKLRRLGQRWPWFDRALDVHERVGAVNGGFVASGITIMIFIALFPLLLVVVAVVGLIASNEPNTASEIIDQLGLSGDAARQVRMAIDTAEESRRAASIVGFAGLLWSALGVTNALQQGVRAPWQETTAGIKSRLLGLGWLLGAFVLFAASLGAGVLVNFAPEGLRILSALAVVAIGLLVEVGLFLWTFWLFGNRHVGWRVFLPGAVLAATGFEVLKLVGTVFVPRLVANSESLYGPLGIVFAILAWLAFFARLIVYASSLNAVLHERRQGTVTLEIKAPRLPGEVPVEATRGGVVVHREANEPGD